jgi:pimeloyl-ACP methyl ester carboxylesterase
MLIVYIHGASATGESFNHIREHITGHQDLVINYDSRNGFQKNLVDMRYQLANFHDIFFICHSLGGVYALHLANDIPDQVLGAVTLSTPYGGAEIADVAKYFMPYSRLLRDVGPSSWAMKQIESINVQHPWTNIVTTEGNVPWVPEPNDGVVTLASQRKHGRDMELVEVSCNHYEVVLNNQVLNLIQARIPV